MLRKNQNNNRQNSPTRASSEWIHWGWFKSSKRLLKRQESTGPRLKNIHENKQKRVSNRKNGVKKGQKEALHRNNKQVSLAKTKDSQREAVRVKSEDWIRAGL